MAFNKKKIMMLCMVIAAVLNVETLSFSKNERVKTQTVYVAVYPSIFYGDKEHTFNLAVTISIRNTDMKQAIIIDAVDSYDTAGKRTNRYLTSKRTMKPLESIHYIIKESETGGGPGANIIITWHSSEPASAPLIESIMIGTKGQQGISFTSRGVVVE